MAPREAEDNADAKFWGDKKKSIMACYGIFWSGQCRGLGTEHTSRKWPIELTAGFEKSPLN